MTDGRGENSDTRAAQQAGLERPQAMANEGTHVKTTWRSLGAVGRCERWGGPKVVSMELLLLLNFVACGGAVCELLLILFAL